MNVIAQNIIEESVKNINSIISANNEINKLRSNCIPYLSDTTIIPKIYNWSKECYSQESKKRIYKTKFSHYFIFVIILLYSPTAFMGKKLKPGLRTIMANLLGHRADSAISNIIPKTILFYNTYKDYKDDVNYIFDYVYIQLKNNNFL